MLFGAVIAPGTSVTPKHDLANIVHLSQLCLNDPQSDEKTYVQLVDGDKSYSICSLQKGVHEHATVDIFFSTSGGLKLTTKGGKNEVHVVGYFEPDEESFVSDSDDEDDDEDDDDLEEEEDGLEGEDGEEDDETAPPSSKRKAGKAKEGKQAK